MFVSAYKQNTMVTARISKGHPGARIILHVIHHGSWPSNDTCDTMVAGHQRSIPVLLYTYMQYPMVAARPSQTSRCLYLLTRVCSTPWWLAIKKASR